MPLFTRRHALGLLGAGAFPSLLARWTSPSWSLDVSPATRSFALRALAR